MKTKIKYSKAPDDVHDALLNAKEVVDFLPPPELRLTKEETKKLQYIFLRKVLIISKMHPKKIIHHISRCVRFLIIILIIMQNRYDTRIDVLVVF